MVDERRDWPTAADRWLAQTLELEASDLHLVEGKRPFARAGGEVQPIGQSVESPDLERLAAILAGDDFARHLSQRGSIDGAMARDCDGQEVRFRFNVFRAMGRLAIAIRILDNRFHTLDELGLSDGLYQLVEQKDGLLLVAGPTGSGKSTTLASMVNYINQHSCRHIITIEDPVEFVHGDLNSMVCQRQIGRDTPDFPQALMDAMRQDPDVILVGELRDLPTIRTAILAAETGHLVLASVHAGDAAGTIERLLSVFPGEEQGAIRGMLASSLRAVIAQHLLPARRDDDDSDQPRQRVLASEVMIVNSAIANLIALGRLNQIGTVLESSRAEGMYPLDQSLAELCRRRKIEPAIASALARDENLLRQAMRAI